MACRTLQRLGQAPLLHRSDLCQLKGCLELPSSVLRPVRLHFQLGQQRKLCAPPSSTIQMESVQWGSIQSTYQTAKQKGAIYQIHTQPETLHDKVLGLEFVLRISEALRDKPKADTHGASKPADAFAMHDNDLAVQNISSTHMLRLNKYNVVPYHSLVITRHFEHQSDPLTEADWSATWQTVQAYPEGALAYYNCGDKSGASQPRKHIQIVPSSLDGESTAPLPFKRHALEAWQQAGSPALQAVEIRQLPFQCFATALPEGVCAARLQQAYTSLMAARSPSSRDASYNIVATDSYMMLTPRSQEKCGPVSCNSLVFAGTLLVRSQEELEFLRHHGPMRILQDVSLPWDP